MNRLMITVLAIVLLMMPVKADNRIAAKGDPASPQEKKLVERVSSFLVKVLAEQPSQNKRYVVTGLAISKDTVLTSALINRFGDECITVVTPSGQRIETDVLGLDQNSSLALLKLKTGTMEFAKRTANVSIGDSVWVVGAFYQHFPSLLKGVVSNADERQIIINAPAIPGVSGGAVITADGALAGIVRGRLGVAWNRDLRIRNEDTELLFPGENPVGQPLLFALPISNAKRIASDLAEFGYLRQGWVGVWCQQMNQSDRIQVTDVTAGSPAEKAGMKPGDEIVAINGNSVQTINDLRRLIFDKRPGDLMEIKVRRNTAEQNVRVKVAEDPRASQFASSPAFPKIPEFIDNPWHLDMPSATDSQYRMMRLRTDPDLGLVGTHLGKKLALKRGIKEGHGIVISEVLSGSPFSSLNLMAGDVVVEVDGRPIRSADDLKNLASSLEILRFDQNAKKKATIRFYRDGKPMTSSIHLQAEPLKADEIRQLRQRMEQVSSMLRDQEFRNLNDVLQRLKDNIKGDRRLDGATELMKMEQRIEQYHQKSKQRIDAEYKYLLDVLNQMRKELGKEKR